MKKQVKKGFTLVELIVVIVVLGILSTISFVSYEGYAEDTRDAKRVSDVNNLVKQLELVKTQGTDIFTIVENSSTTILDNIQISGYTGSGELGSQYISGDVNLANLNVDEDSFTDPSTGDEYKIGVTSYGNRYEIAAAIENDGNPSIYTAGTWLPRTSELARAARNKIVGKIYYMSGATKDSITLEVDDVVRIGTGSASTYTIKKIQLDKIVLDKVVDPSNNGENLFLNNDETRHLIKKWDSDFAIDKDRGTTYTPYDLDI